MKGERWKPFMVTRMHEPGAAIPVRDVASTDASMQPRWQAEVCRDYSVEAE